MRKGSHGSGKLAFPGGHIEMNETWVDCSVREIKEETNLDIINVKYLTATNDPCISGNPSKSLSGMAKTAVSTAWSISLI